MPGHSSTWTKTTASPQRYAVLTDQNLHVFGDGQKNLALTLTDIQEAKTVEGLGVDRLSIIVAGKLAADLRYSRRFRRDMTRLGRKLERRIPTRDTDASPRLARRPSSAKPKSASIVRSAAS